VLFDENSLETKKNKNREAEQISYLKPSELLPKKSPMKMKHEVAMIWVLRAFDFHEKQREYMLIE